MLALGLAPSRALADEPPPPPPPPSRQITMAFTGDILAHVAVNTRAWKYGDKLAYDYRPMFADIEPILSSVDLAVCHLEGPIAPPGVKITGQPVFGSPAGIAHSIAAVGYDRCSTASNHSMDKGIAGINATLNAFDAVGLGHSGTARTPEEAVTPIVDVDGVSVAHLSYSYGFNGGRATVRNAPWRANVIDTTAILAAAADAKARGAEVVVLSLHWGREYRSKPTGLQRSVAKTLTASGLIDLIVGHHAHVLQPIEQINGRWVVFGMGNIVSNQRPITGCPIGSQDGMVVTVEITENPEGGFTVGVPVAHPTLVDPTTYVAMDVKTRLADPTISNSLRNRLTLSLKRTTKVVGAFIPA